tara:strand:- start:194 stop:2071 length:1878 start_codon:yes stop_codon:yes gene_type:complete
MSLVIASNQTSDSITDTQSSIFKPWSFRNDLSSTYTIPANGQVALQSVKYNLDGTIDLSNDGQVFYQYTGEELTKVPTNDEMKDSTAVPIRTEIYKDQGILEVSVEEVASRLQTAMNEKVFHPMLRDLVEVDVKRKSATNEFEGYNIVYKTNDTLTNVIPKGKFGIDGTYQEERDGTATPLWTYTDAGVFSTTSDLPQVQSVLVVDKPLSTYEGTITYNITDIATSTNSFGVGLSRYVKNPESSVGGVVLTVPKYFITDTLWAEGSQEIDQDFMVDFLVYTDPATKNLKVAHAVGGGYATPTDRTTMKEVDYVTNAKSYFSSEYAMGANASNFEKIKFIVTNQQVKVLLIDDRADEFILIDYDPTGAKGVNYKPVNQSCWDLMPWMWLETILGDATNSISLEQMNQCDWIKSYDPDTYKDGSWFNYLEGEGFQIVSQELETRPWNNYDLTNTIVYKGVTTTPDFKFLDIASVLTVLPSDLYKPTIGANSAEILGFEGIVNVVNNSSSADLTRTIPSSTIPSLLSTKTMFLRLDNFTQTTTNAFVGNQSSIIAHLPRFDGQIQTGRIYHEPKNLIYLDLNNSEQLKVNSFDISFCYSNEQYVQALTGQSVVVLYFRQKPETRVDID